MSVSRERHNPLDNLPVDDLLAWCDADPEARYPAIASLIRIAVPTSQANLM